MREVFLAMVPPEARDVLDVGCGGGGLSAQLKARGVRVTGIERNENSCAVARERLDEVIVGDAESADLPWPDGSFDCIIYADVLDCMVDPLSALERHRRCLKQNGHILASMANVRYYKVIAELVLAGTWNYTDGGILWRDHLRFFTLANMTQLFRDAGYEVVEIRRNVVAARLLRILNFLLFGAFKEFLTYQYYIKARRRS